MTPRHSCRFPRRRTLSVGSSIDVERRLHLVVPMFAHRSDTAGRRHPVGSAARNCSPLGRPVATNCVNLTLVFEVTNPPVASAAPVGLTSARVPTGVGLGGIVTTLAGSTGDVTIDGFPTLRTEGSRIFLDAGGGERDAQFSKHRARRRHIPDWRHRTRPTGLSAYFILRLPVLGVGGFAIPALPVSIIFAPPQGQLAKNSNSFTDKVTVSTTTTVSISTQTDRKTVQAYTQADLAGKVAGLATQIAGLVTGYGAHHRGSGKRLADQRDQRTAGRRHVGRHR